MYGVECQDVAEVVMEAHALLSTSTEAIWGHPIVRWQQQGIP